MSFNRLLYVNEELKSAVDVSFLTSHYAYTNQIGDIANSKYDELIVATPSRSEIFGIVSKSQVDDLKFIWKPSISADLGYLFSGIFEKYPSSIVVEATRGQYILKVDKSPSDRTPELRQQEVERILRIAEDTIAIDRNYLIALETSLESASSKIDKILSAAELDSTDRNEGGTSIIEVSPKVSEAAHEAEIQELQNLLKIERAKYRALSGSNLGKLTLKYWNFRRKSNG